MNLKETLNGARERVTAWNEARKERAAVRRMEKQAAMMRDQHAHSRFWLLNVPALATICAAVVEWYWAVLFCIEATGQLGMDWRTSTGSDAPAVGAWHFLFDIQNVWVLIGLILATMPIVMLSMIWLPVQFAMRGAGAYRRGSLIAVGVLANVLVIVSGTVVMNYNRQDQVREALVIEQTADANRAMLTSSVEDLRGELDTLMNHRSTYVATAASVGAVAYERDYVAQARASNDPRLPLLERALGSARRADELRAQIRAARQEVAQAAPAAASQANVQDTVGAELNTFAQYVEVWRPPFVAFICTLIGIFGAWWTLAMLERLNPKDVLRSGWADDGHRIEDLRHEEEIAPQPMKPPREVVTDAQTGEELVKVRPREYWRKRVPKKGVPTRVNVEPETLPDETGVDYDGGARIATREEQAMSGAMVGERESDVPEVHRDDYTGPNNHAHAESEPALAASDAAPPFESAVEAPASQNAEGAGGEAGDHPPEHQPSEPTLTEEEQAELNALNQSLAALGELEPAALSGEEPVAEQGAGTEADAEATEAQSEELEAEVFNHEDLHENQERDEPETRANRLLQPAK